ncbi:MAG TPA: polyphenol oxidase family protein [Candidatus Sulfotelmatobacter sp.]|nr:polyphenol oxidase family protein [Candidatus Sulfotelmatobacter sp.]
MWTFETAPPLPLWHARPVSHRSLLASTTRRGGVSAPPYHALNLGRSTADDPAAVAENRRRVLERLGIPAERLVTAGQVHGARVVRVSEPGHVPECDALVTAEPGLALAVTTADCMPLLYSAPRAVAAAHSGWRGTAEGMPVAALEAIRSLAGCPASEIRVFLGPCIRVCCYEVGAEVAGRFPEAAVRREFARPRLDLPRAAAIQLFAAGLPESALVDCGACTSCQPDWYFSHRRDGAPAGRQWGVAILERESPRATR